MANYFNIFTKYENGIYERLESNYYVVNIKNIDAQTLTDPSTVSISISNNCGVVLVNNAAMTKDNTGIYHYSYDIPADAVFGEYDIVVKATHVASGTTTRYSDKFYVLPWNVIYEVRKLSGITNKKSISDNDLALTIWEAYKEVLDLVFLYYHNDTPKCDPDTGAWIDGTNTTFATKHSPLADHDGDGTITGYGETSCVTDIDGWWKDVDGDCHRVKVTVNEAHCGNITITQLDGSAIPSSAQWVKLNYWVEWETYDERIFKFAVCYLAAHKCIQRFKELDKATIADLDSNKKEILQNLNRMEKEYKEALDKIRKPVIGGAMKPGEGMYGT